MNLPIDPNRKSKAGRLQAGRNPSESRTYRDWVKNSDLAAFRVVVKETDLQVYAERPLAPITRDMVLKYRGHVESYIRQHPLFAETLVPWICPQPAPDIIRKMAEAGQMAGVGPMAAVAGAIAEAVGRQLFSYSSQIIVENGGDIFLKCDRPTTIGVFAGSSPLSQRIGLRIDASSAPMAVCTSSGTVGHSLSLGKADAVCIVARSGALADAVATAVGNRVRDRRDIQRAVLFAKSIAGVKGVAVILGQDLGLWGEMEIVALDGKKG
jgi:ApbE superfamily uncharacterized protein (UPF0280 family)